MHPARSDLNGVCRIQNCGAAQIEPGVDDPSNPYRTGGRCFPHTINVYLARRDVLANGSGISKEDEAKRAKLALELRAHYNGILSGAQPLSQRQRLSLAWALRDKLKITWGGIRGLTGMAQVIADVEALARRVEDP